jgi:hypothetical protein
VVPVPDELADSALSSLPSLNDSLTSSVAAENLSFTLEETCIVKAVFLGTILSLLQYTELTSHTQKKKVSYS